MIFYQKNILLADNNLDTLHLTQTFLESKGYIVFRASSPSEALQLAFNQEIDLILLDVRLNDDGDERDISGINLAKALNGKIATPIIIVTNFESVDVVRESLRRAHGGPAPAVDFVTKQEGFDVLLEAIENAILIDTSRLFIALYSAFSTTELRELCFHLDIDYDDLEGDNKRGKCLALVQLCERNGRLKELAQWGQTVRPNKEWL